MNDIIKLATIVRASGIRGEVKCRHYTSDPTRFLSLNQVIIDNKNYTITNYRYDGDSVFLYFAEVGDRNAAEALVNKDIVIAREHSIELGSDQFFIADLIGCLVEDDSGLSIGRIADVLQNGSVDVLEIRATNNKQILAPFLKKYLVQLDLATKKIVVNRVFFEEVCVEN